MHTAFVTGSARSRWYLVQRYFSELCQSLFHSLVVHRHCLYARFARRLIL